MTDNSITPFLFEGEALVRVVARNGEPLFVGSDVCAVLGHKNHRQALSRLREDEKGVHNLDTLGGRQEVIVVTEPGLYRLIFTSRVASAEDFKRWLAHEVLPSVRKTGAYTAHATVLLPADPRDEVRDVASNRQLVTETRQTWGCRAAQQMWLKLGLPTVPAMLEPQMQPSLFDAYREARP